MCVTALDQLEDVIMSEDGFMAKLRMGRGFDEKQYTQIVSLLEHLALEWKDKDCIPKRAVTLFVYLGPTIEATVNLYSDMDALKIQASADAIMDLIMKCVVNE